jgi:putative transcriptional regulator
MRSKQGSQRTKSEDWMEVRDPGALLEARMERKTPTGSKMSQRHLAYLCECSQTTIYLLESGNMRTLSDELAKQIAYHLGIPVKLLFNARSDAGMRKLAHGVNASRRGPAAAA